MAIRKLARINIVGDEKKVVTIEVSGDGKEWKLRAVETIVEIPNYKPSDDPNEYVHVYILDAIRGLIALGYKFV